MYECFCVQKRPMQTDGWPEVDQGKQPDLIKEEDLLQAKNVILTWIKDLRAQPEVWKIQITTNLTWFCSFIQKKNITLILLQQSVWPGEPVAKVLEDLQSAWRWGRAPNLLTAMELVMWTLMVQRPDKVGVIVAVHRVWSLTPRVLSAVHQV